MFPSTCLFAYFITTELDSKVEEVQEWDNSFKSWSLEVLSLGMKELSDTFI